MPAYPGFFGGSYPAPAFSTDIERAMNLFVEKNQSVGAKSPSSLLSTPGFNRWSTAGVTDTVSRTALYAAGRMFMVIGGGWYEFDVNGTPTRRGTVAQNGNPAQASYNGLIGGQIVIASGGNGYCFVLSSNAFTQVLTGDCDMVAYATGFFLAFCIATGKVRLSALEDGTTWAGAQFFQRSLFSDPWQAMFVDGNGLVWLPGLESFEVWQNTGVGTQPFAPLSGLVGLQGIAAPFAFALTPSPAWLLTNKAGAGLFISMQGSAAQPVSNYAVSSQFSKYARTAPNGINDAVVLSYQDGGHTFVIPSFISAKGSWAFDVESGGWHERGQWNSVRGDWDLWAPSTHVYAFGKHLVGDRTTGSVWQMDTSFATEIDGSGIRRLRKTPAITRELARLPFDRFQLLLDRGLGALTGQGTNPVAMLRTSIDGGQTYGNQRVSGIGRMGDWRRMVYWTRLGANADCSLELVVTDPVPLRISGAWINPTEAELARAA